MSRLNRDWKAVYHANGDFWDVDASESPDLSDDPAERYSVLDSPSEDDARLMAASPKLLAALVNMRSWAIPGMNWTDEVGQLLLSVITPSRERDGFSGEGVLG
jgi:hypothetical protein